ncbi:MAG: PilN domain-containing protein [Acidobacteriota bacterium]
MIYLKTSIGIEIEGEDITLSSLQGNISGGTLTHFSRIQNFRNRDVEDLRQEVQLFLKNNILGKDNIIVGIPRRDILLRHLDLPAEVSDNLKQVIQYQVQSFEPTDEDSYYYDYALLGKDPKTRKISILLAMVRKSLLDEHLQRLFDLGIQPAAVTCSSIALVNLFLQNRKDEQNKTYVMANTSLSNLEILVLRNGIPVHSHEVTKEEHQNWKDLILKETNEAASRTRLDADSTIEEFVLSGDASEAACAELKEAVPECSLLKDVIPVKSNEQTGPHMQNAASTIGLAYTGMARHPAVKLNLLPAAFRFKQTRWAYVSAAVLAVVIIVLFAGMFFHRQIQSRDLAEQLDREIADNKDQVDKILEIREETEALAEEIKFIEDLYRQQDMNLEILQELTDLLPMDTYLFSYTYRDGKVSIGGYSNAASDLILMLESSPLLKDVGQRGSTTRDQRTGKERFQIEATLEE